jgi:GAF domain-containing protein
MASDANAAAGGGAATPGADDDFTRQQRNAEAVESARVAFASSRALEGRNAFLARTTMVLGTSLDTADTLDHIARLSTPDLADVAIVDFIEDGQFKRRAAVVHRDPQMEKKLAGLLKQKRLQPGAPQDLALSTGNPQIGVIDGVPPWSDSTAEGRAIRALRIHSYLVLPVRSRGQILAVLTLLSRSRHAYGANEFATAGEYVRRAAVALDNALLYESIVQARAAAEMAREQFESLINGFRESEDKYRTAFEQYSGGRSDRPSCLRRLPAPEAPRCGCAARARPER